MKKYYLVYFDEEDIERVKEFDSLSNAAEFWKYVKLGDVYNYYKLDIMVEGKDVTEKFKDTLEGNFWYCD